ncbi:mas-related G-protein coupled receptor member X4-like [Sarcophilus harrisii]|uniref:mas-related G-protein coupled receptor member X4-like n=1 Tax=Sarcophilus harrisii TaxID=9305 RepID=UPI001302027F|nr:mas-related G-protein coupled receptor member X4-like [Sarcophilus harrisii]
MVMTVLRREGQMRASWTSEGFHFYHWMYMFSLLVASLGLLGNGVVLWLLGFRIRRTPFSVYILNLAGADALFLCYSLLFMIIFNLRYLFYTAGLSLLAAISTERCLSALFPIWYRCRCPKHTSVLVCAGLWALAGMMQVTEAATLHYVDPGGFYVNFLIIYILWLLLLTCVLCVSSLTLLLRVQCSSWRRRPPRLYLLVMLTVLVFLLCGLPWGVGDFINHHFRIELMPYSLSQSLACVNSSVNPFIYFFVGKRGHKRREPLRLVLQRALGEEQEVGGGMRDIPQSNTQETSS